ncbi:MAG: hypothetical protein ACK44W_17650, partial [Planctomycetota bacterium]
PAARPAGSALVVATLPNDPSRVLVFAYPRGADLTGGPAPERRVGFSFPEDSGVGFTEDAWALFDAAALWCLAAEP